MAKMTTLAMEKWLNHENDSLFNGIVLNTDIDRDILVNNILLESAEFEVVYSDPYFYKDAVDLFFRKWKRTFDRWVETLNEEYDPLQNYNGYEEITSDYGARHSASKKGEVRTENTYGEQKNTNSYGAVTGNSETSPTSSTTTDQTSAFDSEGWSNANKSTTSAERITTSNTTNTHTDTVTSDEHTDGAKIFEHTDEDNSDAYTDKVRTEKAGNLGVTTSQSMAIDEINLRKKYNVYKLITDLFIDEFCIAVYI